MTVNNLKKYLDYIFSAFEGMKVGHGGFYTRKWSFDKNTDREFKKHLNDVVNILVQNEGIIIDTYTSDIPFVKLGQMGYDYMEGGDLELSKFSIAQHIDLSQSKDDIYNRIWDFIGNEKSAPLYLKGSDYFYTIAPYIGLSSYTYSQYTQQRIAEGKSASRNVWFRETFYALKPEDMELFLDDLGRKIIEIYQPLYRIPVEDEDNVILDISSMPMQKISKNADVFTTSKKKVIFISYTWETENTPGHKQWVLKLAERLSSEGFDVRFDQFQSLGTNMNQFMINSVKEADRILLICTPTFKLKSDDFIAASGFEASMISNMLIKDINSNKFLPIIRIGEPSEVMPDYLGNRNALIWHETADDEKCFELLIHDLKQYS